MIFLNYTARGVIIASMITIHLEDLQIYSEVFYKNLIERQLKMRLFEFVQPNSSSLHDI